MRAQCYLCGLVGATTKDHVIPDCFFTDPRPPNLLTLRAHDVCNGKYKVSDEYARNILASLGMDGSKTAQTLWLGKVDRSIAGNQALRKHIASSLIPKADKFSAGGIYLGSAPGLRIDVKRFYPTMGKIIRGLHRHCSGTVMPNDAKFRWFLQEPLHGYRLRIFEAASPSLGYSDVFASRFFLFTDENDCVIGAQWWLRFYNTTTLECHVRFRGISAPAGFRPSQASGRVI
jgi:hypothetical protein